VEVQTSFIRKLTSDLTVEQLMDEVVSKVAELLKPDACAVFTRDRQNGHAVQRAGWGYQQRFTGEHDVRVIAAKDVPDEPEPGQELGLTGWILSTGKPFLARTAAELHAHPHHSGRFDAVQMPGRELVLGSFLGVPFRGPRGEVTGMIKAERRLAGPGESEAVSAEPFAEEDELALAMIARVAGRAIMYLEMARRGEESEALTAWACDVIAEAAAMEAELDSFLDTVVPVTAAAMRADS
jgi:GAF domain-containing protein